MHRFTDRAGRLWKIEINVTAVKAVRKADIDVDLLALVENECRQLGALLANPIQLVDTLWVLCMAQAEEQGVSDVDFGRGLGGKELEAAAAAFLAELGDFFHEPAKRAALSKMRQTLQILNEEALAEVEKLTPTAIAEKVKAMLEAQRKTREAAAAAAAGATAGAADGEACGRMTFGGSSGSAPASLACTLASGPSPSS